MYKAKLLINSSLACKQVDTKILRLTGRRCILFHAGPNSPERNMGAAAQVKALLKVSASVSVLMAYARFAAGKLPPGRRRLLALLPAIVAFFFLPFLFSSIHLRSISGFFLSWLGTFKLLLLSFAEGPLSPSLPFPTFLSVASLPVKIRTPSSSPTPKPSNFLPSAVKALLFSFLMSLYPRRHDYPRFLLLAIYCIHIYLALELILSAAAFLAARLLSLDLEPQFKAPYRSTSLQDFWGRRWNLMVTAILRPTVYGPARTRWGSAAAVMAVFLVSGVMHELLFFYITLMPPTGEVLCFFVLHGACLAAEMRVKRAVGGGAGRRLNPAAAAVMTLGFVAGTGFWLFFPQILRNGSDERVLEEMQATVRFFEGGTRVVLGRVGLCTNRTEPAVY